jgi:rhodanese-related sulfurtransferase
MLRARFVGFNITPSMKNITCAELQLLIVGNANLALIDVRTPVEFAEVHVPGARNYPLDELQPKTLVESNSLPRNEPVYILCRSGNRATKAAEKFAKDGFNQAVVVAGGTLAWIEAGLPVTRGKVKVISLERQVRIAAGSLVLVGVLLGWFLNRGFFGLSAFVGAGLVFAGVTDFCGMGLLLAKLPWNKRLPN